jgi:hypothetical protein
LVKSIAGLVSMRVDTSGCTRRFSHPHHPTSTAAPPSPQASVRPDTQPQALPWVMANSTADNPTANPMAPSQSIDPFPRCRRAGTRNTTIASTTTVNPVVSQNTRW